MKFYLAQYRTSVEKEFLELTNTYGFTAKIKSFPPQDLRKTPQFAYEDSRKLICLTRKMDNKSISIWVRRKYPRSPPLIFINGDDNDDKSGESKNCRLSESDILYTQL